MLGILFSSIRRRRAFSWLLQYSPYTENLSLCKTGGGGESGLSICQKKEHGPPASNIALCLLGRMLDV